MPGHEPTSSADGGEAPRREPLADLLTVHLEPGADAVEAAVSGELDQGTAPGLVEQLEPHAASGRPLVIDLSGLTFCGSAGLSALVILNRAAEGSGGSVAVRNPSEFVTQLLDMAGLAGLIIDAG